MGITWAQFPHLFPNFYVYQYATGISAANALAAACSSEGSPAAKLQALPQGGRARLPARRPEAGGHRHDLPEPVERAFGVFEGLIDRLEKLVGGSA